MKLTKEEFIQRMTEELGAIPDNVDAVPCENCAYDNCCGWILVMKGKETEYSPDHYKKEDGSNGNEGTKGC